MSYAQCMRIKFHDAVKINFVLVISNETLKPELIPSETNWKSGPEYAVKMLSFTLVI